MTAIPKYYKALALLIIILVLGYFSVQYVATQRMVELQTTIETKISDQKDTLVAISEITARNGADDATELVVQDCAVSERKNFDTLLGRLDSGLSQTELTELDRLFGRCGYYFAQRKSIMVARLTREVEIYDSLVSQLEIVTGASKKETYNVETWQSLARDEEKQSELFTDLVRTQDRIIATLLSGKPATSPEIQTILNEVKETQETLSVTNMQTADLRAQLLIE